MHISDGILEPQWIILWWMIAIAFITAGVVQIRQRAKGNPQCLPALALMGAAVLVFRCGISLYQSQGRVPIPVERPWQLLW